MKKIALITGAGRRQGLGFATAKQLGKLGYHVIISARKLEQVLPLAGELTTEGSSAEGIKIDLLEEQTISDAAKYIKEKYGKLDVLINNAAMLRDGSMGTMDEISNNELRMEINTNVIGTWIMTRTMHPLLKASGSGRVVNVSSGAGSYGDKEFGLLRSEDGPMGEWPISLYGITKLAVNGITIKEAREFRDDHILVNSVCPGITASYDMNNFGGLSPDESAKHVVWAATLPDNGPTGGFFRYSKTLPW